MTWRIALLCALVCGVAMAYEIPEAAISCYLIIFLMKPDAVVNIVTAIGLMVVVTLAVAGIAALINYTAEPPLLRIATIALVSFVFLFIGSASQLGEMGGIVALVFAFALTLVSKLPFSDAGSIALQYAWYMVLLPMAMMLVFNLALGFSPVKLLRQRLRHRLAVTAEAIESGTPDAHGPLIEALRDGNSEAEKQAGMVKLLHLAPADSARQIASDVRASFRLMLAASALPGDLDADRRATLASAINRTIAALDSGEMPPQPAAPAPEAGAAERNMREALANLAGAPEGEVINPPKAPFFFPDALSNPDYQRFALKTTAAAVLCYVIYTGIDWSGIHTAMITCYVAALGTTGETVHKLGLRITGCLVGAAIGIGSILFVIPHIDSVGALMALIFCGVFVGAWVSTGNERIAYGGVQIALAFLLTVVQGFGPSLDLDSARDRVFGILLGNLVVYLIFTQIWTVPVERAVRERLSDALGGLARLAGMEPASRAGVVPQAAAVEEQLAKCEDALELVPFEPREIRPSDRTERALREANEEIAALNRDIFLSGEDLAGVSTLLQRLSGEVRAGSTAANGTEAPSLAAMPEALRPRLARLQTAVAG